MTVLMPNSPINTSSDGSIDINRLYIAMTLARLARLQQEFQDVATEMGSLGFQQSTGPGAEALVDLAQATKELATAGAGMVGRTRTQIKFVENNFVVADESVAQAIERFRDFQNSFWCGYPRPNTSYPDGAVIM